MKYSITALVRTADVMEADTQEQALMLFRAKYPAMADKTSQILEVREIPSTLMEKYGDHRC